MVPFIQCFRFLLVLFCHLLSLLSVVFSFLKEDNVRESVLFLLLFLIRRKHSVVVYVEVVNVSLVRSCIGTKHKHSSSAIISLCLSECFFNFFNFTFISTQ